MILPTLLVRRLFVLIFGLCDVVVGGRSDEGLGAGFLECGGIVLFFREPDHLKFCARRQWL